MGDSNPMEGLHTISRNVPEQTISKFNFFKDSHLIGCPFRTFHRGDGFLLTMSPMSGVNYMDKDFSLYLSEPPEIAFDNEEISALGLCFKAFADQGTTTWHRRSVEWFLIYLLTEVSITPHPMRQGYNAPELHAAYSAVIQGTSSFDWLSRFLVPPPSQPSPPTPLLPLFPPLPTNHLAHIQFSDLKYRRFEQWQPKVTVRLVRRYLTCLDELTYITLNLKFKLNLFEQTLRDVKDFEAEDEKLGKIPNNPEGESMVERLEWAMGTIKSDSDSFERLLVDLKSSLDAVCCFLSSASLSPSRFCSQPTRRPRLYVAALPNPQHRAKRPSNPLRRTEQSHPRFHRRHHDIPAPLILHKLLWYEPQGCD